MARVIVSPHRVDVGEVSRLKSVAEDREGTSRHCCVEEQWDHCGVDMVGWLQRTEDVEEPERQRRQAHRVLERQGVGLGGNLAYCVRAHRPCRERFVFGKLKGGAVDR